MAFTTGNGRRGPEGALKGFVVSAAIVALGLCACVAILAGLYLS
jgi:hypothetical protein